MAAITWYFIYAAFGHTWIIEKRERSVARLLEGFPVPMKRYDSSERSAMLTMSCFHPWTLRQSDAEDDHVPFAGCLRKHATWEETLADWLNGNVVSQESATHVSNFLSVPRATV